MGGSRLRIMESGCVSSVVSYCPERNNLRGFFVYTKRLGSALRSPRVQLEPPPLRRARLSVFSSLFAFLVEELTCIFFTSFFFSG